MLPIAHGGCAMKLSWKDLGSAISKIAPALGAALGGPFGAIAGSVMATTFGVDPSPDSVAEVLKNNKESKEKLMELEYEYKKTVVTSEKDIENKYLDEVNNTMRHEASSEHWAQYSWRPFIGFAMGISFMMVSAISGILGYQAVISKDAQALGQISDILFSYSALFSIPGGVLGIASWHRGASNKD